MTGAVRALLVMAAGLLVTGACTPRGPNVLILSIDSLRHDAMREAVAPSLTRFSGEAAVYEQAVSPAPWTTPAMMSVMTGLPAAAHGVDEHDRALGRSVETLAERFRDAGWSTAAFVPEVTLRAEFGFDRGFEEFDESRYGHARLSSPEMIGRVMQRIENRGSRPFFVWAHLWDPHYNYTPPPDLAREFDRGRKPGSDDVQCLKWRERPVSAKEADWLHGQHEAEVRYTDRYIGDLLGFLEERELAGSTIVVIVADHGEAFLEHGWLGHTNRLDEVLVRVPLMLRGPGVGAPSSIDAPVSTASLGRTLLGLAGLDGSGFGLEPALSLGGVADSELSPLAETRRRGCMTSLRDGPLKLVVDHRTCATQLFDVVADETGSDDLAASRPADVSRLLDRLGRRMADVDDIAAPAARLDADASPDTNDALRSLGYLPSGPPGGAARPADPCATQPGEAARDSFGDLIVDRPCPPAGVRACLPARD